MERRKKNEKTQGRQKNGKKKRRQGTGKSELKDLKKKWTARK